MGPGHIRPGQIRPGHIRPGHIRLLVGLTTLAAIAWAVATPAIAHDYEVNGIVVEHPWARATAPRQPAGAVYVTLRNTGARDDRLIGAATPIAETSGLHTTRNDGGIMRMRPVKVVEVPAGAAATLAPGGQHIMLVGLTEPLEVGNLLPLTLTFERAGTVDIEVFIDIPGAGAASHDDHAAN